MNLKEYTKEIDLLGEEFIQNIPFLEIRRFLPDIRIFGEDLYLTDTGDPLLEKDLLQFIRSLIILGGYTKEEIFIQSMQSSDTNEKLDK